MINYLNKKVTLKIDRPLGSKHPEHNLIYPINYGYIEGTIAGDGEEIDAYVLGVFEPIESFTGYVVGIIKRNNDIEDKLVVAKQINSYDKLQIKALTEFQERFFSIDIITHDFLRQSIRNTVRGIIRQDKKILVFEEEYQGQVYYYLPGGGIEFLETSSEALKREIREELNVDICDYKHLHTITNIFEVDGIKAHEITQIYEINTSDHNKLIDGKIMNGDLMPCLIRWIPIEELKKGNINLYPKELVKLI
ncbi:MAG: hypothetical protein CVV00_10045 [Firmicutes bacterium HGW-Firmicutes-5]|nr:MAG: hypothetical protein CVV00_10045 [Firmicutes bacterium HGW-Firmicutes-5]